MRSTTRSVFSFSNPRKLIASCLSTLAILMMLQDSLVFAEESKDPFEDLRIRIAHLEKDNQELRTSLSKSPGDESIAPLVSELPPLPPEPDGANGGPGDHKMESLVDGLIRRLDAQNQKIAALETKVNTKPKPTSASGNFGPTGLVFTSADGNFKTHFGGTAQLDFIAPESQAASVGNLGGPNTNTTQDATNFRRLRIRADGTMYENIDWVSECDLAFALQNTTNLSASLADNGLRSFPSGVLTGAGPQGGNTTNVIQPTTVWMTFKEVPIVQNIRVGNQQDWFSLDHIMSARFLDFMERAPIMDAFAGANNNGYTPGVSAFGNSEDKNKGLQLGIYKNNVYDSGQTFDIGNAFTYGGRAIYVPYYDEESHGRYLVHTALGAEYRSFNTNLPAGQAGENVRVRSRGDLRIVSSTITPNFADTGNFFALGQTVIDPEIAIVWGPWTFQAEYTASWFNGAKTQKGPLGVDLGQSFMYGGYVEGLYFWTGENKIYNRQTGAFGQVIPINNFKPSECKYGAWQSGVRYDWMDLNSGLISGGQNQNGTLGLNWFLNPNIRFQFNTVFSYINNNNTGVANPGIGAPGIAAGSLNGSKFTGEGLLVTLGTRMDITF